MVNTLNLLSFNTITVKFIYIHCHLMLFIDNQSMRITFEHIIQLFFRISLFEGSSHWRWWPRCLSYNFLPCSLSSQVCKSSSFNDIFQ